LSENTTLLSPQSSCVQCSETEKFSTIQKLSAKFRQKPKLTEANRNFQNKTQNYTTFPVKTSWSLSQTYTKTHTPKKTKPPFFLSKPPKETPFPGEYFPSTI